MIEIIVAVIIALLVWFLYEVRTAPFGWEDEEGFHEERKEQ